MFLKLAGENSDALQKAGLLLVAAGFLLLFFLLVYLLLRRRDIRFRSSFVLAGLVFLSLSIYAVLQALHLTRDFYFLTTGSILLTGVLSTLSAVFLARLIPYALRLPSPSQVEKEMQRAAEEINRYEDMQEQLRLAQENLEKTVNERTRQLRETNERLEHQNQQRQKIEKDLSESEKHFRALIENALDITVVLDRSARIIEASPSVKSILGYLPGELIDKRVFDFIHPDELSEIKMSFERGLEKSRVSRFIEFHFRKKDGSWCALEATGKNLLDDSAIQGVIINARDIAERKQAEKEMRFLPAAVQKINQCDDFISALETALTDLCDLTGWSYGETWIPREDGKVLECSPAWYGDDRFKAFYENSRELKVLPNMGLAGCVWKSKQSLWIPDLPAEHHGFMRHELAAESGLKAGFGVPIMSGGDVLAVMVFLLQENKKEYARLLPLVSTVAAQLGAVLQRKRAQEDLRRAYDELEKRIRERTDELAGSNEILQKEIAERKNIEEALKKSEHNYQTLVNSVDGILWEYDLQESRFSFVSKQAEKILGYPLTQWFSESSFWQDRVHGEDREAVLKFRQKVASDGNGEHCEYRMVTAEGKTIWIRDMVSAVKDHDEPVKLRGMMMDITVRKIAETTWQEERNFISAVLDTASALVMILNDQGQVVRMNQACEKICGYQNGQLEGKPFWDVFLIPEEIDTVKAIFTRLLAGQFPATFESYWVSSDGTRRIIAWSNTVLTRTNRGVPHVIATGIDITKRREVEQKLQETVADLAETNKNLDKYSEQLEHANKSLKKLDELKSQFISAASHELKTPLTSLKGYVEMVLQEEAGPINGEQKEYLTYVKESTDRLHRLLKELLDISKIESGQIRMSRDHTDLKVLVKEEIALFKAQAGEKNIKLSMDIDEALNHIYCDADKIREVMDNLLSNAIKYTPSKGEVKISARDHREGVEIRVSDTGIGIKKEDQYKIFEPFQHISKSGHAGNEDSTGLGLTLVKRIIEAHGGNIKVESEEGKGTVFTVMLPLDMKSMTIVELIGQDHE